MHLPALATPKKGCLCRACDSFTGTFACLRTIATRKVYSAQPMQASAGHAVPLSWHCISCPPDNSKAGDTWTASGKPMQACAVHAAPPPGQWHCTCTAHPAARESGPAGPGSTALAPALARRVRPPPAPDQALLNLTRQLPARTRAFMVHESAVAACMGADCYLARLYSRSLWQAHVSGQKA